MSAALRGCSQFLQVTTTLSSLVLPIQYKTLLNQRVFNKLLVYLTILYDIRFMVINFYLLEFNAV
jgi:hypothetical protein